MTIVFFFHLDNKDFKKIQLIITFTKVANSIKKATNIIKNLAIVAKKKKTIIINFKV